MIIPIAIGAAALLFVLSQGKENGTSSSEKVVYDTAEITELANEAEYIAFVDALGTDDIPAGAALVLLPGEEIDANVFAADLGDLGYSDLGVVVLTEEGFDPPRLLTIGSTHQENLTLETDSLEDTVEKIGELAKAVREDEAERAAAGHAFRRRVVDRRGRAGYVLVGRAHNVDRRGRIGYGRMTPTETPSHGRGLRPDGGQVFAMDLNPGEHAAYGRGLMGGKDPLQGVPAHMRAALRREMRRVMARGLTRNPKVAARIAVNRIARK